MDNYHLSRLLRALSLKGLQQLCTKYGLSAASNTKSPLVARLIEYADPVIRATVVAEAEDLLEKELVSRKRKRQEQELRRQGQQQGQDPGQQLGGDQLGQLGQQLGQQLGGDQLGGDQPDQEQHPPNVPKPPKLAKLAKPRAVRSLLRAFDEVAGLTYPPHPDVPDGGLLTVHEHLKHPAAYECTLLTAC